MATLRRYVNRPLGGSVRYKQVRYNSLSKPLLSVRMRISPVWQEIGFGRSLLRDLFQAGRQYFTSHDLYGRKGLRITI